MLTGVKMTFHDENMRDPADTFDVELTLKDAFQIAKKLQEIIHNDVAQRHGINPTAK